MGFPKRERKKKKKVNTLLVPEFSAFLNLVPKFSFVSLVLHEFRGKNHFDTSVTFSV
jgi:hypothetical protein